MKGYRRALGEFVIRSGKMVISYFDLQSEAREEKRKEDLKDAISRYCLAVISEDDLYSIAVRRGAFDTDAYKRHLNRCKERQHQYREIIENLGGVIMDRTLISIGTINTCPPLIEESLKEKFGDEVDCDCSTDILEVNYPHRLEGKLTLFMDEVYPEVQYEIEDLDDQFIAGIFNFMEAERWLIDNGYEVQHTDYRRYIQAPPLNPISLEEHLGQAVLLLERTGLSVEELIEELTERMVRSGFPLHGLDKAVEVEDMDEITDKDIQRAALGIVMDAGYDDPKVLHRALVDANLAEEDKP